jgi:hypothetical protein
MATSCVSCLRWPRTFEANIGGANQIGAVPEDIISHSLLDLSAHGASSPETVVQDHRELVLA